MTTLALAAATLLAAPITAPADTTASPQMRPQLLWTTQAFDAMRFLYERITAIDGGVEFAACLRAKREAEGWVVTEVTIPAQSGNTATGIEEASCPEDFQGIAHSHPLWNGQRNCYPSVNDRASWRRSAHPIMVVWCDVESFEYRTTDGGIGGKDTYPDPRRTTGAGPFLAPTP